MWVPVWEARVSTVSRYPSRSSAAAGTRAGAGEPGYMGISGVMVWVRSMSKGTFLLLQGRRCQRRSR